MISGGVFYKQLTDFIFNQTFTYTGPIAAFAGQLGTRPENGGTDTYWDSRVSGFSVSSSFRARGRGSASMPTTRTSSRARS